MKRIDFKAPHPPNEREKYRNQEHRRGMEVINQNFSDTETYLNSIVTSFQAYVAAKNLPPWEPPPSPFGGS
jgi:hypothetical protein